MRYGGWGGRPGWGGVDRGLVGEGELLGCEAAEKPVRPVLGGGDLGAYGEAEVEFSEIAEPDSVPWADLVVNRKVDGDGLADTEASSAPTAAGRGPDRAFAMPKAGSMWARPAVAELVR